MTKVFHSKNALAYALVSPAAVGWRFSCCIRSFSTSSSPSPTGGWRHLKNPSFGLEYGLAEPQSRLLRYPLLNTPASTFWNVFHPHHSVDGHQPFFHVLGGMGLALLLNRPLKLRGIYRTLLIIPWAIPQVIAALAWKGEFHQQYGFVNIVLGPARHSRTLVAARWHVGLCGRADYQHLAGHSVHDGRDSGRIAEYCRRLF